MTARDESVHPGRRVWMGSLDGLGAVCDTCGSIFITSPDEPASVCLPCDLRSRR